MQPACFQQHSNARSRGGKGRQSDWHADNFPRGTMEFISNLRSLRGIHGLWFGSQWTGVCIAEAPYIIHHQRAPELSEKAKLPVTCRKGVPCRSRLKARADPSEEENIHSCLNGRCFSVDLADTIYTCNLSACFAELINTLPF